MDDNALYAGLPKPLEMLMLQQRDGNNRNNPTHARLWWFLHAVHQEHVRLCRGVFHAMAVANPRAPAKP